MCESLLETYSYYKTHVYGDWRGAFHGGLTSVHGTLYKGYYPRADSRFAPSP